MINIKTKVDLFTLCDMVAGLEGLMATMNYRTDTNQVLFYIKEENTDAQVMMLIINTAPETVGVDLENALNEVKKLQEEYS